MQDTIEKESETVIRITKDIPAQTKIVTYDINLLIGKKKRIEADIISKQADLARVVDLITKAKSVGVE